MILHTLLALAAATIEPPQAHHRFVKTTPKPNATKNSKGELVGPPPPDSGDGVGDGGGEGDDDGAADSDVEDIGGSVGSTQRQMAIAMFKGISSSLSTTVKDERCRLLECGNHVRIGGGGLADDGVSREQ